MKETKCSQKKNKRRQKNTCQKWFVLCTRRRSKYPDQSLRQGKVDVKCGPAKQSVVLCPGYSPWLILLLLNICPSVWTDSQLAPGLTEQICPVMSHPHQIVLSLSKRSLAFPLIYSPPTTKASIDPPIALFCFVCFSLQLAKYRSEFHTRAIRLAVTTCIEKTSNTCNCFYQSN